MLLSAGEVWVCGEAELSPQSRGQASCLAGFFPGEGGAGAPGAMLQHRAPGALLRVSCACAAVVRESTSENDRDAGTSHVWALEAVLLLKASLAAARMSSRSSAPGSTH